MKWLSVFFLVIATSNAAFSQQVDVQATIESVKKEGVVAGTSTMKRNVRCMPIQTSSILDDSVIMADVLKELTWSLSKRGYYIPIFTRCDSTSKIRLTLASMWDLWLSYGKRNNIPQDEFRELISSRIKSGGVMYDICPEDFEYLYGRDSVLGRGVAFECDTLPPESVANVQSQDIEALMSWAFDTRGYYKRELQWLPYVAYRLLPYGIVLQCVLGTKIYYEDISNRHLNKIDIKELE